MRFSLILAVIAVIALAVKVANHAPNVAPIQTVVEKPAVVVVPEAKDQLGDQDQRVDADPPSSPEQEAIAVEPAHTTEEAVADQSKAAEVTVDHSQCPHKIICDQGDCQRDYAIIFSTKWCGPCKQLHKVADKLIAQGYRIYYWDAEQAPSMAKRFQIDAVPTTLFFNEGELRHRFTGVIAEKLFRDNLKPRYKLVP